GRPQPAQAGRVSPGHAHPDPRSAGDRANPTRLRADPALESRGRDRRADVADPVLGRQVRDSDSGGASAMKVVLFCGGMGMRLRDHSESLPKPLVTIGPRPILWNLMKYYAHYGHRDFILCLGHGAEAIKSYFLKYDERLSNDFVLRKGGADVQLLARDIDDW